MQARANGEKSVSDLNRRATVTDVAKNAGVSKSTVSLAFSAPQRVGEVTRTRILEAAQAVGYTPDPLAQSLKTGRRNLIGLILPDLTNPHGGAVLERVQAAANQAGYMVMTATANQDPARDLEFVDGFRKLKLEGVVLMPSGTDGAYVQALAGSGVQFVTYGQRLAQLDCDHVGLKNDHATLILTRHLIARGHRRIGHIAGDQRTWSGRERLRGVRAALAEAGLTLRDQDLVFGDYDVRKSETVACALLAQSDRPTALVTANNVAAIGLMRAIRHLSLRCPEDVALATVDEIPFDDLLTPTITCAVQPIHDMAQRAASWLIERLENPVSMRSAQRAEFPATLRIGGSS
jgi:LacI family transcriptional regulator